MDAFLLKKVLSNVVHIVPGAFIALLVGVALLRLLPRFSRALLFSISAALLTISSPPVSNAIVGSLERQFPVVQSLPEDTALILVLGLGHRWSEELPANSVLMAGALSRLAEAVRLLKSHPNARLMVSGAKFRSEISHADAMGRMAFEWGVPESKLVYARSSKDTADEIEIASQWMQENATHDYRLVVVSSAMHLPRAASMLKETKFDYTMAPTDFRKLDAPWFRFNSNHLRDVDWAIHEYVGMAWYQITNSF